MPVGKDMFGYLFQHAVGVIEKFGYEAASLFGIGRKELFQFLFLSMVIFHLTYFINTAIF